MKAFLNVKVDQQTKMEAQKLAEEMGLSLSAVINGNLRTFIADRAVHFEAPYKMSKQLEKTLKPIDADIRAGRNLVGPFDSTEELDQYLAKL